MRLFIVLHQGPLSHIAIFSSQKSIVLMVEWLVDSYDRNVTGLNGLVERLYRPLAVESVRICTGRRDKASFYWST